jgi:hypothetical protein
MQIQRRVLSGGPCSVAAAAAPSHLHMARGVFRKICRRRG